MQTEFPAKYKTLGLKVRYYRNQANLSVAQLAEKASISAHFLAQVEAPGIITGVSLEVLFRLARALNISASKLLEDD